MTDITLATAMAAGAAVCRTEADRYGDRLTVKDFGAKGDGITDDTVSVQSAMLAAAAQKTQLYVQPGVYVITAKLIIPSGLYLTGAGSYASPAGWMSPSMFKFMVDGPCLGVTDPYFANVTIEKMGFVGDYLTYPNQIGLFLDDSVRSAFSVVLLTMRDCLFKWFSTGVSIGSKYQTIFGFNIACISNSNIGLQAATSDCYFFQLTCGNSGEGIHTGGAATAQLLVGSLAPTGNACGYCIFMGGAFFNGERTVIIANSNGNSIIGAAIQNAQQEGLRIGDGINAADNNRIIGCNFSGNNAAGGPGNVNGLYNPDVNVLSSARNTHLRDSTFSDNDATPARRGAGVYVNKDTDGLMVLGCAFNLDGMKTPGGGPTVPVLTASDVNYASMRFANCSALTGFGGQCCWRRALRLSTTTATHSAPDLER